MGSYSSSADVFGTCLKLRKLGTGQVLLFLDAGMGVDPGINAMELLAERYNVICPSHPGFGFSDRPKFLTTVDDLSYFYLDMLDTLDLDDVVLTGVSFGAWIAAEIAVKSTARIAKLVMVNPVGIKVSDRETRDVTDIFALTDQELNEMMFHNPQFGTRDYKTMAEADVLAVAQSRESLARFAWSPYMHDPKLKSRLHRIDVPTLFVRGAEDRLISEDYVRQYCAAVPGARMETIAAAGHLPQVEQPQAFADCVLNFLDERHLTPMMKG